MEEVFELIALVKDCTPHFKHNIELVAEETCQTSLRPASHPLSPPFTPASASRRYNPQHLASAALYLFLLVQGFLETVLGGPVGIHARAAWKCKGINSPWANP